MNQSFPYLMLFSSKGVFKELLYTLLQSLLSGVATPSSVFCSNGCINRRRNPINLSSSWAKCLLKKNSVTAVDSSVEVCTICHVSVQYVHVFLSAPAWQTDCSASCPTSSFSCRQHFPSVNLWLWVTCCLTDCTSSWEENPSSLTGGSTLRSSELGNEETNK